MLKLDEPQAANRASGQAGQGAAHTITLADGTAIIVRGIQPEDAPALRRFHSRLSTHAIYHRFFAWLPELSAERAEYFTHLDPAYRQALVAEDPDAPGELIGVIRYDRTPGTDRAEYAAVLADRWQGRGLGRRMTRELIGIAWGQGIRYLDAYIMLDNRPMRQLLAHMDLPMTVRWEDEMIHAELDLNQIQQPDSYPIG
jgi:RimJ/RimL family protein N-acetyltransferase